MIPALVLIFCRVVVASVFALSATGKALDFRAFRESVSDFRLLPHSWSKAMAWSFLGAEIVIVLLMAIGKNTLLIGFLLATGLLVVFSVALVVALHRNARMICNCFGRTERPISPYDVARNALLVLCCLAGVQALVGPSYGLAVVDHVLIGLIAASFVVLVTNLRDVVETLRQPFHLT